MTRTLSLVVIVGAALVLAAPAFGTGERFADAPQWQQALMARSEALNQKHGLGEHSPAVQALILRGEALNQKYGLGEHAQSSARVLDARERALGVRGEIPGSSAIDSRERSLGVRNDAAYASDFVADGFAQAVRPHDTVSGPVRDDRFNLEPTTVPVAVTTGSGREIEWPQVGIGFGVGILLALGLVLAMRATRIRPLAH